MPERHKTALCAFDVLESCLDRVKKADAEYGGSDGFVVAALESRDVLNEAPLPKELRDRIERVVRFFILSIYDARESAKNDAFAIASFIVRGVAPSIARFALRAVTFLAFFALSCACAAAARYSCALIALILAATTVKLNAPLNAAVKIIRARSARNGKT